MKVVVNVKESMFINRVVAMGYDLVLLMILAVIALLGAGYLNKEYFLLNDTYFYTIAGVIFFILYFIFFVIIPVKLKGTVGKSFCDLEVKPTFGKMTMGRWLFRELIFKYLFYLTLIGIIIDILYMIFKHKTVHDEYLKTIVVKKQ